MGKKHCPGAHKGHLCNFAKARKLKKIAALSSKPAYICKKCARVADCAENLCHPKAL